MFAKCGNIVESIFFCFKCSERPINWKSFAVLVNCSAHRFRFQQLFTTIKNEREIYTNSLSNVFVYASVGFMYEVISVARYDDFVPFNRDYLKN